MRGMTIIGAALALAVGVLTLGSCAAGEAPPTAALRGTLAPGEHEATLRGARIWYRVAGTWDGRSPPVVYLAGGPGGNSYSFSKLAGPALEASQLMVYYDQRGTGRSERPKSGGYSIAGLVDDIEALRIHLGVPKIALLAHSFGGVLALEYGAKYPDRLAAAILAGTLWNAPLSCAEQAERIAELHPDKYKALTADGTAPSDLGCERVFGAFSNQEREGFMRANMFPIEETHDRFTRSESESGLKNTGELGQAVFSQGLLRYQFAGASRLTAPVLIVSGSRDFAAGPRTQRRLAQLLPNAELIEYTGLGHWMFLDDPELFARDVSAFLGRKSRRR